MLTARQKSVLDFIKSELAAKGIAPSMREIADHIGTKGFGNIPRTLEILEEKGCIKRMRGRARAIEVVTKVSPDEIARLKAEHDKRVTELLNANTDLVNRCRAAEAKLREHGIAL
jgi:SOS-response transcriptional repressor LexA